MGEWRSAWALRCRATHGVEQWLNVDVIEIFGEVGLTSEGGDEGLPGGGGFKLRHEFGY
jgi:hypothetical protein